MTKLRLRAASLAALLLLSCGSDPTEPEDPRPSAAAFDRFWRDFDRTYSYFQYKSIDWSAGRDSARERAARATTDSALVAVLLDYVKPLRDVHVWFRRPNGSVVPSYSPVRTPNWNLDAWVRQLPRLNWRQGVTNWGWGRAGDVGYITIGAWNTSQVRIADLEAALEQLRDTRALIIDVRANGGGSDGLALQFAGRFSGSKVRFGAIRYRDGSAHDDFGRTIDRYLEPRGAWQYTKPVYLLIGPACFSSNETFIAALGVLPHVTTAGDVTGGSSGNPQEFTLRVGDRDTGWKYAVPRWIETTADGTVIEWNGIRPDVPLAVPPGSFPTRDPVLDWALTTAMN